MSEVNPLGRFDPGLDVEALVEPLGWRIGAGCFGPTPELRRLADIRASLRDPGCAGPDPVYAICMDVGRAEHAAELRARMLLFGMVTYAAGRLGEEPVRSQGHVHKVSSHSGWRPPEVYEIWSGRAVIYMQEFAADEPGRCFAVGAGPGEVVVVPPGWAHATVSADPRVPLTFGAWCDREYGFEYAEVRSRGGLAWYPLLDGAGRLSWRANPRYATGGAGGGLIEKSPRRYDELGIEAGVVIYEQFARDPGRFQWVSRPGEVAGAWEGFVP